MLWGVRMVRTGIMRAFGDRLQQMLAIAIRGRLSSFATGLLITVFLQSSTATALIISSFASKGLIDLSAALAVMLGADIGTTIAAQVLSTNPVGLPYLALFIGFILHGKSQVYARRQIGRSFLGLGLILIALSLIRNSSEPLRQSELLSFIFSALEHEILLTIFLTAILTWLVHSSLAVVLLIAAMFASQLIPFGTALVMILGANIGGTIPPILATMNSEGEGQLAAIGNACFKLGASLILLPFLPFITEYLKEFASVPAIMVHLHTAFNCLIAITFLPFVSLCACLLKRYISRPEILSQEHTTKHLDKAFISSPKLALTGATRELYRMTEYIEEALSLLQQSVETVAKLDLTTLRDLRLRVAIIEEELKLFLTEMTRENVSKDHSKTAFNLLLISNNLWHVSELVGNAAETLDSHSKSPSRFSEEGAEELLNMITIIRNGLHLILASCLHNDQKIKKNIQKHRKELEKMIDESRIAHFNRLEGRDVLTLQTSSLHNELLRDFSRIYYHIFSASKIGE